MTLCFRELDSNFEYFKVHIQVLEYLSKMEVEYWLVKKDKTLSFFLFSSLPNLSRPCVMWFCWSIAWINWNGCSGSGIWDACDWVYSHAHLCDCCSPASRYTDWIVQWKMWVRGDHWLTKDLITSRIQQMSRIRIALLEFHVSFGYKPGIFQLLHPATLKSYNRTHQFVHWRQTLAAVQFFSWFIIRVALTHLSCQLLMSL